MSAALEDSRAVSGSLLQRVAAGEMSSMQECIDEYGGLIWSLARRSCPSPTEAEDAVQEVFIALWENASRFDPDKGAEITFVAMIARRRIIDRTRKLTRQRRLISEAQEQYGAEPGVSPDEVSAVHEAQRALEAMKELSASQQKVLHLAIHEGYTHEQIAGIKHAGCGLSH